MRLGRFEVGIRGHHECSKGYVVLGHAETYILEITNHYINRRAEATVQIDGKEVGTWRLSESQTIRLERPANETGKFTFYLDGTEQSRAAGITDGDSKNGLIAVTFVAEERPTLEMAYSLTNSVQRERCRAVPSTLHFSGATGLSGNSDQTFRTVSEINKDRSTTTTIHLRLVGDDTIRPLHSTHDKPPLSNPIPMPVGAHSYGFFSR